MPSQSERQSDVEYHDDDTPVYIGQWCCGCAEHPIGKPWGWNYEAWERHWDERHPLPPQPETEYRPEDFA